MSEPTPKRHASELHLGAARTMSSLSDQNDMSLRRQMELVSETWSSHPQVSGTLTVDMIALLETLNLGGIETVIRSEDNSKLVLRSSFTKQLNPLLQQTPRSPNMLLEGDAVQRLGPVGGEGSILRLLSVAHSSAVGKVDPSIILGLRKDGAELVLELLRQVANSAPGIPMTLLIHSNHVGWERLLLSGPPLGFTVSEYPDWYTQFLCTSIDYLEVILSGISIAAGMPRMLRSMALQIGGSVFLVAVAFATKDQIRSSLLKVMDLCLIELEKPFTPTDDRVELSNALGGISKCLVTLELPQASFSNFAERIKAVKKKLDNRGATPLQQRLIGFLPKPEDMTNFANVTPPTGSKTETVGVFAEPLRLSGYKLSDLPEGAQLTAAKQFVHDTVKLAQTLMSGIGLDDNGLETCKELFVIGKPIEVLGTPIKRSVSASYGNLAFEELGVGWTTKLKMEWTPWFRQQIETFGDSSSLDAYVGVHSKPSLLCVAAGGKWWPFWAFVVDINAVDSTLVVIVLGANRALLPALLETHYAEEPLPPAPFLTCKDFFTVPSVDLSWLAQCLSRSNEIGCDPTSERFMFDCFLRNDVLSSAEGLALKPHERATLRQIVNFVTLEGTRRVHGSGLDPLQTEIVESIFTTSSLLKFIEGPAGCGKTVTATALSSILAQFAYNHQESRSAVVLKEIADIRGKQTNASSGKSDIDRVGIALNLNREFENLSQVYDRYGPTLHVASSEGAVLTAKQIIGKCTFDGATCSTIAEILVQAANRAGKSPLRTALERELATLVMCLRQLHSVIAEPDLPLSLSYSFSERLLLPNHAKEFAADPIHGPNLFRAFFALERRHSAELPSEHTAKFTIPPPAPIFPVNVTDLAPQKVFAISTDGRTRYKEWLENQVRQLAMDIMDHSLLRYMARLSSNYIDLVEALVLLECRKVASLGVSVASCQQYNNLLRRLPVSAVVVDDFDALDDWDVFSLPPVSRGGLIVKPILSFSSERLSNPFDAASLSLRIAKGLVKRGTVSLHRLTISRRTPPVIARAVEEISEGKLLVGAAHENAQHSVNRQLILPISIWTHSYSPRADSQFSLVVESLELELTMAASLLKFLHIESTVLAVVPPLVQCAKLILQRLGIPPSRCVEQPQPSKTVLICFTGAMQRKGSWLLRWTLQASQSVLVLSSAIDWSRETILGKFAGAAIHSSQTDKVISDPAMALLQSASDSTATPPPINPQPRPFVTLCCPNHPQSWWCLLAPNQQSRTPRVLEPSGCQRVCMKTYENCDNDKHRCLLKCHPDSHSTCPFLCGKRLQCGHRCTGRCGEPCKCNFVPLVQLSCGTRVVSGFESGQVKFTVFPHFQAVACGGSLQSCQEPLVRFCPDCHSPYRSTCSSTTVDCGFCANASDSLRRANNVTDLSGALLSTLKQQQHEMKERNLLLEKKLALQLNKEGAATNKLYNREHQRVEQCRRTQEEKEQKVAELFEEEEAATIRLARTALAEGRNATETEGIARTALARELTDALHEQVQLVEAGKSE